MTTWILGVDHTGDNREEFSFFGSEEDAYLAAFRPLLLDEHYHNRADPDEQVVVFSLLAGHRYEELAKAIRDGELPYAFNTVGELRVFSATPVSYSTKFHNDFERKAQQRLQAIKDLPGRCGYCGGRIVEGDEVHPGYDGWPCCEECKAV